MAARRVPGEIVRITGGSFTGFFATVKGRHKKSGVRVEIERPGFAATIPLILGVGDIEPATFAEAF
jgi:transcription antitermination factor NusG